MNCSDLVIGSSIIMTGSIVMTFVCKEVINKTCHIGKKVNDKEKEDGSLQPRQLTRPAANVATFLTGTVMGLSILSKIIPQTHC